MVKLIYNSKKKKKEYICMCFMCIGSRGIYRTLLLIQISHVLINAASLEQRLETVLHVIRGRIPTKYKFCTKDTSKIVQTNY